MTEHLHRHLATGPTMWIAVAGHGEVLEATANVGRFLNLPLEAIVGRLIWELGPNVTRENWPAYVEQARADGFVDFETLVQPGVGAARAVRLRIESSPGDGGILICRVEPVHAADEPVRVGEEYWFRCISRFGEDGFWAYDVPGQTLVINPQWYAMVGRMPRPKERLDAVQSHLHPEDAERLETLYGELVAGRVERLSTRTRLRHRDGHYIWVRHRAYVVARGPGGEAAAIVGHDVDITAEVEAEARAQAEEQRLRRLLDRIPVAVLVYGPDGDVRQWNPAAAELFGVPYGELPAAVSRQRAQGWDMLDESGSPLAQGEMPLFKAMATGEPSLGRVLGVARGHKRQWGLASAIPHRGDDGAIEDIVLTVTDITESRRLESALARSQRFESLGRLAGGVAHDFNNLLTVVTSTAEMMALDVEPGSPARADLDELLRAADRGARLTRQLLDYARQAPQKTRVLDLAEQIRGSAGMLRRLLPPGIELRLDLPESVWGVRFDSSQLDQILVNLVVNAADAIGDDEGAIDIRISNVRPAPADAEAAVGDRVRLAVRDTGGGMAEDVRARALEPFFTTKPPEIGTGLGLSTCFGLVRQHGGEMHLDSVQGQGTVVEILLPRAQGSATSSAPPLPAEAPGGSLRVLLVEDEVRVREVARRALTALGCHVLIARDGMEALSLLEDAGELDLLITDVKMPGIDGRALASAVRRLRPRLPILLTSGYGPGVLGAVGEAAGVEFLSKPFGPRLLTERVNEMLQRSKPA